MTGPEWFTAAECVAVLAADLVGAWLAFLMFRAMYRVLKARGA